jgi:hypothetical protein
MCLSMIYKPRQWGLGPLGMSIHEHQTYWLSNYSVKKEREMTSETPLFCSAVMLFVLTFSRQRIFTVRHLRSVPRTCATAFRTNTLPASSEIFLPRNVGSRSSYYERFTITHNMAISRCTFITHREVWHSQLAIYFNSFRIPRTADISKLSGIMLLSDWVALDINLKNVPRDTKDMGLLRGFYVHAYNLEFKTPFSPSEPEPEPGTQNLKSTYEFKDKHTFNWISWTEMYKHG